MKDKEAREKIKELETANEALYDEIRKIKSQIYMKKHKIPSYVYPYEAKYDYGFPIKEVIEKLLDHLNLYSQYHSKKPAHYTLEEKSKE